MIKKLRVTVDGQTYEVTVELSDEAAAPAAVATTPRLMPAVAPALITPVAVSAPARPAASATKAGDNDIPSPLSGRVTAINAQTGQAVKEGEHLLTLEAMKMNTFITAPRNGTVQAIKVAIGDVVDEGQALVTLE